MAAVAMITDLAIPDLLGTCPADLLPDVELPQSTAVEARSRTERIRAGLADYTRMRQDIADARAGRDWLPLGHGSWFEYVEAEFGEALRLLARDDRREAVADLRSQGMSTRQIGAVVGVADQTVRADLAQVRDFTHLPETVTGTDGKTYPASRPSTPDPVPMPKGQDVADRIVADIDRHAATPEPERPRPPAWDPEERRAHEEEVRRLDDIRSARQQAETLVPDVRALIFTVLQGSRQDKDALKGLITRDMIADLRRAVDLLEGEIDDEE